MRQRVLKNKENILKENKAYLAFSDPKQGKGQWKALFNRSDDFGGDRSSLPLYLEIGSGKGQFIVGMAKAHPEANFLACEGGVNIYPRILQKAGSEKLNNLLLIPEYIIDPKDCFLLGELSGVYLNFSDPWPKDRYAHRRLTHVNKLLSYKEILNPGSFLEFKTDNDALFEFSLEQAELAGLSLDYVTRDLHQSPLAKDNITTEYEDKFSEKGKTINFLRIRF